MEELKALNTIKMLLEDHSLLTEVQEELQTLETSLKRLTPTKPNKTILRSWTSPTTKNGPTYHNYAHTCPSCEDILLLSGDDSEGYGNQIEPDFCPSCGQNIQWKDDAEQLLDEQRTVEEELWRELLRRADKGVIASEEKVAQETHNPALGKYAKEKNKE